MHISERLKIASRTTTAMIKSDGDAGKVFSIGFNKTGSTSLHSIFKDLGYLSYHGTAWRKTSRPLIYFLYDSFCDGVPDNLRRLDRMFPKSKFILQVRNLDEWLDSRLEHIRREPNKNRRDFDPDWNMSDEAVCGWVRKRNLYHADVLSYFADRPTDCLTVNYIRDPDAAAKIRNFLGKPGLAEKPHSNRNPDAGKELRHGDTITRCLTHLQVPKAEWSHDLLCSNLPTDVGDISDMPTDTGLSDPAQNLA